MAPHQPQNQNQNHEGPGKAAQDGLEADRIPVTPTTPADAKHNGIPTRDPPLFHKVKNRRSILALAISDGKIFAGTQGGDILIWSLETFKLVGNIAAHRGAVLALCPSDDGSLLFSGGGDALVNVWNTGDLQQVYSIYSFYDVGDIFCVVYSSRLETVYFGAQNTSIQWFNLARRNERPPPDLNRHPSHRVHRFFDSKGPGGISTPRAHDALEYFDREGMKLEIDKGDILQYAHFGYVYCMLLAKGLGWVDASEEVLITGGGDGSVKLWNLDSDTGAISLYHKYENGDSSVLSMALNGTFLYTGKLEGDVDVWDLNTKQLIQTVNVYQADVLTIQAGHGLMFTGGTDGNVKILERYKTKNTWQAHEQLILASAITSYRQKNFLITGGNDDCVAIWDITDTTAGPITTNRASNEELIDALGRFVSFRSVSSKPEYTEDCRQAASFLKRLLERRGANPKLLNTDKSWNPVVYGRFKGNKSERCTLFYGHYDVVPAEDKAKRWISSPFSLHGQDAYLYGRGVSDNKGPIMAAVFAAADLAAEKKLEHDIVFLIEGEEECGSRGFRETFKKHKDIIGHIDHVLFANSYWLTDSIPCLTYGLRGVVHATVHVESGREDLHSGVSGSWLVSEPLKDLTVLLSRLSGAENRINIPGFYDKILGVTSIEDGLFSEISKILENMTVGDTPADMSADSLKAKWREPSLTIHNFKTSGSGNSTIIPHRASAAISLRLVPDQDSLDIQQSLIGYLEQEFLELKTTNKLRIVTEDPADPWLGDPQNKVFQTLEKAVVDVWNMGKRPNLDVDAPSGTASASEFASQKLPRSAGRTDNESPIDSTEMPKPLYIREGGSIPAIRFLEKELGAPAAQLPCGQASDNAHLDNERLSLTNLYNSRKIFRKVFRELGL